MVLVNILPQAPPMRLSQGSQRTECPYYGNCELHRQGKHNTLDQNIVFDLL